MRLLELLSIKREFITIYVTLLPFYIDLCWNLSAFLWIKCETRYKDSFLCAEARLHYFITSSKTSPFMVSTPKRFLTMPVRLLSCNVCEGQSVQTQPVELICCEFWIRTDHCRKSISFFSPSLWVPFWNKKLKPYYSQWQIWMMGPDWGTHLKKGAHLENEQKCYTPF